MDFFYLSLNVKPSGSKWVYEMKHKSYGTIQRYKARIIAKGYNQVDRLDFFDTFSLVSKVTLVRTLFASSSINYWNLHQMDISNEFLHGDLHE